MIKNLVKESLHGQMAEIMMGNGAKIYNTAKDHSLFQMETNLSVSIIMVDNMEEEHMCGKMEEKEMESGIIVRENIGLMKYHPSKT